MKFSPSSRVRNSNLDPVNHMAQHFRKADKDNVSEMKLSPFSGGMGGSRNPGLDPVTQMAQSLGKVEKVNFPKLKLSSSSGGIGNTRGLGLDPVGQMTKNPRNMSKYETLKANLDYSESSFDGTSNEILPLLGKSKEKDDRKDGNLLVPPWKTCLVISVSFLFVYTAFEAIQNLQSSLNHEGNLGVWSLSALYASLILGAVVGPCCLQVLSPKKLLQLGFIFHLCYITSNFYPVFALLIPVSVLVGFGIGGQAISQSLYLAAASDSYVFYNNLTPERLHGVLSMFNGVFFACFKGTHLTGNLISSLILFTSSYNTTVLEENICGRDVCGWEENSTTVIMKPDNGVVWNLMGVFALCTVVGLIILSVGLPKLSVASCRTSPVSASVTRSLADCVKRICTVKFLLVMPMFMAQAMVVMIVYTAYTQAFVSCTIGVQWVGYTMIFLGVAGAFSSLTVNYITRYVGRMSVFLLGIVMDIGSVFAMLTWVPDSTTYKPLLFVLPTVAGFSEGILQPQFNALIATVFKDDLASAYAAFQASKGLAFSICLGMSGMACLSHKLYLALSLHSMGLVGYLVTEYMETQKRGQSNEFEDIMNYETVYAEVKSGTEGELRVTLPVGNKLYAEMDGCTEISSDEEEDETSFRKSRLKLY